MFLAKLPSTAVIALFALGACGVIPASNPSIPEPDQTLPLLSDLEIADDAQNVTLAAPVPPGEGGLLGRLLGRADPPTGVDAALSEALDDAPESGAVPVAASPARTGLFGRLLNVGGGTPAVPAPSAPTNEMPPRTIMAFGEIAPTCNLARADRGKKIASASGYTIYDTIPNSTAPRPHYITGFRDGCARQFTAALVMFGDVGTHEVVRYSPTRVDLPYSATDSAYESIKTSFCRTGFGKPCGARLDRLARRTTFVTAYECFGAGPVWAEFLLHDGAVAAADIEGK